MSAPRNKPMPSIGATNPSAERRTGKPPSYLLSGSQDSPSSLVHTPPGPNKWKWPNTHLDEASFLSHANTDVCSSARSNGCQCFKPANTRDLDSSVNDQSQHPSSLRAMLSMDSGCLSSRWRSPDFITQQPYSNNDNNPSPDDFEGDSNSTGVKPSTTINSELLPNENYGAIRAVPEYSKTWEVERGSEAKELVMEPQQPEGKGTTTRLCPIP